MVQLEKLRPWKFRNLQENLTHHTLHRLKPYYTTTLVLHNFPLDAQLKSYFRRASYVSHPVYMVRVLSTL